MKVYIVLGETSGYEDCETWVVGAYKTKKDADYVAKNADKIAQGHIDKAARIYDKWMKNSSQSTFKKYCSIKETARNRYDPKMRELSRFVKYFVQEEELK